MNFACISELRAFLAERFAGDKTAGNWEIIPEIPPPDMRGDLTVNCFRLAAILKQKPDAIAEVALEFLRRRPEVEQAEKIKAFVNIVVKPEALYRASVGQVGELLKAAPVATAERKKILLEYSAPNTNKPQHLGHVRNNTLGLALTALWRRVGHDVVAVNLINDRGIHICKSMLAYQRFGGGVTPEKTGRKGDHLVGDFYVRFNTELRQQLDDLRRKNPDLKDSDDDLFSATEIGQAAQKMLQNWENGDPSVRELWRRLNDWVIAGFDRTYARMGVKFDQVYLESETYLLGKDLVAAGVTSGVFTRRADGAIMVELEKMGEKCLLRADGTSVYITQDLGTTLKKYEDFRPQRQVWIVGDEQVLHFKQLFATMKKMGYAWADHLFHLAYGMVNLPSGKMKSREGAVVDADELFDEMKALAKAATLERCGAEVPDDLEPRAEIIGMGALKFMLLKFNPKSAIMFDPQASVKFEGDTGPYVQYACARINSIQRKGEARGISVDKAAVDWSQLTTEMEKKVAIRAFFYPHILQTAAERMDPSTLVEYLLELAKDFNRFYRECPVLNADQEPLRNARLALCFAVRDLLADGLQTLTIAVPEAM